MLKGVLFKKLWNASRNKGHFDYLHTNARRSQKLNERVERLVLRKMKLNPKLRAPKIASNIVDECKKHATPKTIRIFHKIVLQYAEEFKGSSSFIRRTI